jgi:hypothetical protein
MLVADARDAEGNSDVGGATSTHSITSNSARNSGVRYEREATGMAKGRAADAQKRRTAEE